MNKHIYLDFVAVEEQLEAMIKNISKMILLHQNVIEAAKAFIEDQQYKGTIADGCKEELSKMLIPGLEALITAMQATLDSDKKYLKEIVKQHENNKKSSEELKKHINRLIDTTEDIKRTEAELLKMMEPENTKLN